MASGTVTDTEVGLGASRATETDASPDTEPAVAFTLTVTAPAAAASLVTVRVPSAMVMPAASAGSMLHTTFSSVIALPYWSVTTAVYFSSTEPLAGTAMLSAPLTSTLEATGASRATLIVTSLEVLPAS